MRSIKIVATSRYLPKRKVDLKELASLLNVTEDFILSRTGIETRYYVENESLDYLANMAAKDLIESANIDKNSIDMIIVATTTTNILMPGVSYKVQKELEIKNCICLDILAGCAGFINAFDVARMYIALGKCNNALIIGADVLSKYTNKNDISTAVVLSDGAGAVFIEKTDDEKKYVSDIVSEGSKGDILTCNVNDYIYMNGKEIYKYAITETVKSVQRLLDMSNEDLDSISYIVPHQANLRIIESVVNKLKMTDSKMFKNIQNVGNTFCASIPIALNDMFKNGLLKEKDKIVLLGFGGGLNTGSILIEI